MRLAIILLIQLLAINLTGATYYVSPTGSSSNSGTYASPWSVAKANTTVVAGDVIIFKNGTYTGGISISKSGTSSNYITWTVESVGGVVLDGQSNTSTTALGLSGKSYLNIIGFEIKDYAGWGVVVTGGSSYINLSQLHIHHIGRRCTDTTDGLDAYFLGSSSYITIDRNLIHDIGRFSDGEEGCSPSQTYYKANDHAVYVDACSHVTIMNNVFYNIGHGFAFQLYSGAGGTSSYVDFINNTCENGNPYHYAGHVILWGNYNNSLIANNIFKDHLRYAIQVYQGSYTYSNVTITKNISYGGNSTFSTGTATGVTFSNNTIKDPLFNDEPNHAYTLKSGSPAINLGYETGLKTDHVDNARDVTIDIGAYEYCSLKSTSITLTATAGTIAAYGGTTTLTAIATGGTAPYTYSLNGGAYQSGNTFTVTAGTYIVTVKDVDGKSATLNTVIITQPANNLTVTATAGTITAFGGTTTLTANATGGTGTYTYSLNGGAYQSGNTFSVKSGTYTVTVKDGNSITATAGTVTVNQPQALTVTATSGTIAAFGGTTTLTANATGGTTPYTYSLNGGAYQSGNTFSVKSGTYTVTVKDGNGITASSSSVTVAQPANNLTVTVTAGTITAFGGTTTLTANATGGTGTYTYSLNGGAYQSGNTFSVKSGTYTVTVKDGNGITTSSSSVTVAQPANNLVVTATAGTITAFGGTTTLTANATGGTGTYTYSLNGGAYQSGNTFTVPAGTYTVTVKDGNSTTATTGTVTVNQPQALTVTATSGTIAAFGGTTTLTANATGGTTPYTYSLNGGAYQSGNTFSVKSGTFTVTVKDGNGITASSSSVTVAQPANNLVVTATAGTIAAFGGTTTLTINATGGTTPYTYSLNGGAYQSGNTFTVPAGTYTVTVKDGNSITATAGTVTVNQPQALTVTATSGTIAAFGGTTTLTANATGGTTPYTYSLNGGAYQSGNTFTVPAGTYTVTVKDGNSITATAGTVTVNQPQALTVTATSGTIAAFGGTTTLTINATGGTGTYTYSLNGGAYQSLNTFTVPAGTYTITVKDGNSITATAGTVTVNQPQELTVTATSGTIAAFGGTTTLTANATGGTTPYTYSLNGGAYQSGNTFTVPAGIYTVTVKDGNSITATAGTVTVNQPQELTVIATSGTIAAFGGTTTLTANATGGTGTYTYSLNGGAYQSLNTFTVPAGTYTITVKDGNSITATAGTVTVNQPQELTVTATSGTIAAFGGTTTLTANATGGTTPYTYSLNGGAYQSGNTFTVPAGIYTVTVKDGNRITATAGTVTVNQPQELTVIATSGTIAAFGGTTTLTANATGGTGTYTYSLNGGAYQSLNTFTVPAGTYTITVKDGNSITATAGTVTVNQPQELTVTATSGTIAAYGGTTTLTANATGGTAPYTYSLNDGAYQSENTFTVTAGTYTVSVKDGTTNKSIIYTTITVTQPAQDLSVTATAGTINTYGGTTTLTANATGGTEPYTYSLNGGTYQSDNTFMVAAGTYTVTAKDGTNKSVTMTSITVTQPDQIQTVQSNLIQNNLTTTKLVYKGAQAVQYGSKVSLSATLSYDYKSLKNKIITFTIGTQSTTAVTNSSGVASASLLIDQVPGNYKVVTSFKGDAIYGVSGDSDSFIISKKVLTAGLTGTVSKIYDGTTKATLMPENYTLKGTFNNDDVQLNYPSTGTYKTKNVGTNILVTVSGLALTGAKAIYYKLSGPYTSARVGVITALLSSEATSSAITPVLKSADITAPETAENPVVNEWAVTEEQACTMVIPNGFSPNGDGINDLFKITCMSNYPDARISIFNAAGQQVFQKSNYGNVDFWGSEQDAWWDGTDNVRSSGSKLPIGTYLFILELVKGDKSLVKKATIYISY